VACVNQWLQQLRDHYGKGRRPRHLDMAVLARALRAMGVSTRLVQQNTDTYLLNVGPAVADIDGMHGMDQAVVVCGPVETVERRAVGFIGTFAVGPAGQPLNPGAAGGAGTLLDPDRPWRVCEVVPVVLACLDAQVARCGHDGAAMRAHTLLVRRRVDAAVQQATEAFWTTVSRAFPEVTPETWTRWRSFGCSRC
jgi:hypothetical protein